MSDERLPVIIDPIKLAEERSQLSGVLASDTMSRLIELIAEPLPEITISLEFGKDLEGWAYIQGDVTTVARLICQRCLQPFDYPIDAEFLLTPVMKDMAIEQLPERYEPFVTHGKSVELASLIEDELILNLPLVAKHDIASCETKLNPTLEEDEVTVRKKNPFSELANLKKSKKSSD